jgi:hypothetical protein
VHPYSIDAEERRTVPFFLAILGILAALGLNKSLAWLNFSLPWWFDAPATMGFYTLFYMAFDRWIWRLSLLHTLALIRTPRLSGKWKAEIASSFGERGGTHAANVEIRQTWTRIVIELETAHSRSHSSVAGVVLDAPNGPVLTYEYLNEPTGAATTTMHMHRGVARLRLTSQGQVLQGEYYSGRDRQNHGSLRLDHE